MEAQNPRVVTQGRQQPVQRRPADANQRLRRIRADGLDLIGEQGHEVRDGARIARQAQPFGGVHPHNPIPVRQASDERVHDARVRQVLEHGHGDFLHVAVGVLQRNDQCGDRRGPDLPQRARRRIPDRPILVMEHLQERAHRPGVAKLAQQSRRIFPERPVLVLQCGYFLEHPITHNPPRPMPCDAYKLLN